MNIDKAFGAWFELNHPKSWDSDDDAEKEEVDYWCHKQELTKEAFKAGFVLGNASDPFSNVSSNYYHQLPSLNNKIDNP